MLWSSLFSGSRRSAPLPPLVSWVWRLVLLVAIALGGIALGDGLVWLGMERLWFAELGQTGVLWRRLGAGWGLGLGGSVISMAVIGANLGLAYRLQTRLAQYQAEYRSEYRSGYQVNAQADALPSNLAPPRSERSRPRSWLAWQPTPLVEPTGDAKGLGLRSLLLVSGLLWTILAFVLAHYTQAGLNHLQSGSQFLTTLPPLPPQLDLRMAWELLKGVRSQPWGLALGLAGAIALARFPWTMLIGLGGIFSLGLGITLAGHGTQALLALNPVAFGEQDFQFGRDISFFFFTLPLLELVRFWWVGLALFTVLAVGLAYLLGQGSLEQGSFAGLAPAQRHHLQRLGCGVMLGVAFSHWLSRYGRLYQQRGVTFGLSYTDAQVQLPVDMALVVTALAIALWLGWCSLGSGHRLGRLRSRMTQSIRRHPSQDRTKLPPSLHPRIWLIRYPLVNLWACYLILVLILGNGLPALVQSFWVQPNEFDRERPYIDRSIAATRHAFSLDQIETQTFDPSGSLSAQDLKVNQATLNNIRLWDTRPLLATNRQLQQIRLYYRFAGADIDRYAFPTPDGPKSQQILISARELDYTTVPPEAQTWVNEHMVYTHGYGFTLSPVNTAGAEGLPQYFVRDIGSTSKTGNAVIEGNPALGISAAAVQATIPLRSPRIYYGELTNTYVLTQSRYPELDYPSGDTNASNRYDGRAGIALGSPGRRWLAGIYLRDWRIPLTRDLTPQSRLLWRRNIRQRVQAIAPFLRYDRNPYLVVTEASNSPNDPNTLYWILDAYTTSDRYPYADPGRHPFNYLRNSVKVVVDAYHGSVRFYIADPSDPILRAWQRIFPSLFQPLDAMPSNLRRHLRYPLDLFDIQSERLLAYHMTDATVFYNREDQWQAPSEIYGGEARPVEPYYLIMQLPSAPQEEFVLLQPFTPQGRTNLTAWLAARSDSENYGKLLLYTFPKQRLIFGPEQIEARINQIPEISERISLWNRQGSRAIQGNLLVIPIERSLLYVEPLYLEAETNSLPTLARVIVAHNNAIAMRPSLREALQDLFPTARPEASRQLPRTRN